MQRALAIAFLLAGPACTLFESDGESPPDAGPNGSGSSAVFEGDDPSPPDITLQWIVVGLSTIAVAGSLRSRRRESEPDSL